MSVPRTVQPVSLAEKAYDAIRDLIVSLELAPGAVIDERELMERLGIGRTPVREALRRLAHEGLVEVYPRRGMFVAGVDVRALDERIHAAVYRAAHNDLLAATLSQYYVLALRIWSMALDQTHDLAEAV